MAGPTGGRLNPNPQRPFWTHGSQSPLVTPALVETLTDDFATLDSAKWTTAGTIASTGGQLDITPNALPNYSIYKSVNEYSLIESSCFIEVPQISTGDISADTDFVLVPRGESPTNGDNRLTFATENGTLHFQSRAGGVNDDTTLTYDAVAHRWWRFTESAGTVTWWTSPDGSTWTSRKTKARSAIAFGLSQLHVSLDAGWWSGGSPTLTHSLFDNLNLASSGVTVNSAVAIANASALPQSNFIVDFVSSATAATANGSASASVVSVALVDPAATANASAAISTVQVNMLDLVATANATGTPATLAASFADTVAIANAAGVPLTVTQTNIVGAANAANASGVGPTMAVQVVDTVATANAQANASAAQISVPVPPAIANAVGNPPTNFPDIATEPPNQVRLVHHQQHTDQVYHVGANRRS